MDERWQQFPDEEVTPRFPDGLTVVPAYGQWRSEVAKPPPRLRSLVLIILHPDSPARVADSEAIRTAGRARAGAESVLRETHAVDVSF